MLNWTEDETEFAQIVRSWADKNYPKERARELEAREHEYPEELWRDMAAAGFHGIGIPEEFGGQGGGEVTQMILAKEMARTLASLTYAWGTSSFSGGKSVGLYGTEEQKREYLPRLAEGDVKFAISVTEPSGGTDLLGALRTTARRTDGGWILNGQKTWVSGATVADYLLVIARTDDSSPKPALGTTVLLVPNPSPGVTIRPIPKLGMRCISSCDVFYDDVFVADSQVLGEVGRGWYQLIATLNNERVMEAAVCCGVLDAILEDAVEYAKMRRAFGKTIGEFQSIQHFIANIHMLREQAHAVTFSAARMLEEGKDAMTQALTAKIVASEAAVAAADMGIQILGGMGYSMETDMQRYWRDTRLYRIGPISNEMGRNLIAESHGLGRSF